MKKILFSLLFCTATYAQILGIGGGVSYPTGKFEAGVNFGYNVGLTFHVPVFGIHTVAYVAYQLWDEKTVTSPNGYRADIEYKNFPIALAGARKYFGKFYASALAGIYPVDLKVKETRSDTAGDEIVEYNSTTTQGTLVPGVGYVLPFAPVDLDLNLNYLWNEDYSQLLFTLSVIL
jgi:hypothetical protein